MIGAGPTVNTVGWRRKLQPQGVLSRRIFSTCTVIFLLCALAATAADAPFVVTQRGRTFTPGHLVVARGDTVEIVNDDGELIHHVYVSSDTFSFDSGDQAPGSKTAVVFTVAGRFTVLCGIHPKMHLEVEVK